MLKGEYLLGTSQNQATLTAFFLSTIQSMGGNGF